MTSLPRRIGADLGRLVTSPVGLILAAATLAGTFALLNVFPPAAHAAAEARGDAQAGPEAGAPALSAQQRAEFLKWYEALPTVSVPIDRGGAKVLVVDFSDFQCPYCRQSFVDYRPIVEKYRASGQLKFVLKHYPLESECNPSVARDLHPAACEAAAAVVMAEPRGTAAKLEDWLFANQASLTPAVVREAAASVGGVTDFDAQYPRALTLVRTDAGMGALIGVKSTPTFVINGRLVAGALPPAMFEAAIEYELGR